jgi:hypothetical protein
MEGHEQVAQRVQRQHRHVQVAGGRRDVGQAAAATGLRFAGDALHAAVEHGLGAALRGIGIEWVDDVVVVHRDTGLARQRAVADTEAEQEVARHVVPELPALLEQRSHAARAQLHHRLEILAVGIQREGEKRSQPGLGGGHGSRQVVVAIRVELAHPAGVWAPTLKSRKKSNSS